MRKLVTALAIVMFLVTAIPVVPALAGNSVKVGIVENTKDLKMASKVSKSTNKDKKKNTKSRLKKLKQLGINQPKSYINYGKDLSLREMGNIIAAWIIKVWVGTGQLPTVLIDNPPSWLMLNINGSCLSGPCERWEEA